MSSITAQLAALPSAADKPSAYRAVLTTLLSPTSSSPADSLPSNLSQLTSTLFNDVPIVTARPFVSDLIEGVIRAEHLQPAVKQAVYEKLLEQLEPRAVSYEEQIALVREKLAEILEADEEWSAAARVLMAIKFDGGARVVTDEYKLRKYIHIVRLLLEDDDTVTADTYLKRAGALIGPHHSPVDQLMYKMCHARILDANRNFIQASHKYLELSYATVIETEEKVQLLEKAVTCAVLAGAGPQRSRLLAQLYKDERVQKLPVQYWGMLEKMHLSRILKAHEVKEFVKTLQGHHLAKLADGTTVLDRAVIQHNLLSASLVYANISFQELGRLLSISLQEAESLAARMIAEHRLRGRVDQIEGLVYFQSKSVLASWDSRVAAMCTRVDDLVGALASTGASAQPEAMQVE